MSGSQFDLFPFQEAALKQMMDLERDRMREIAALNQQMMDIVTETNIRQQAGDGQGYGDGCGSDSGYGDGNGYGTSSGFPDGHMAEGEALYGHGSFGEDGAFVWSSMRPTDRVFRCAGCIGGYECSIHGRRL